VVAATMASTCERNVSGLASGLVCVSRCRWS
jgi:hypothetical protein